MTNSYFTPSGNPAPASQLSSAVVRNSMLNVESAFDKLPALAGNASKPVMVNSSETALIGVTSAAQKNAFISALGITSTITELNHCNGVTSNVQDQIDSLSPSVAGTGERNTKLGEKALQANTTGSGNTAIGYEALLSNTVGHENTAIGRQALSAHTNGQSNVAVGLFAHGSLTTGSTNIAIGHFTSAVQASASNCTYIGGSISGTNGATNEISIGYDADCNGNNSITLGGGLTVKTVLNGGVLVGGTQTTSGGGPTVTLKNNASIGATPVDTISIASSDISAGNTTLNLVTEGSPISTISPTSPNRTLAIKINGTTYFLAAKTTND